MTKRYVVLDMGEYGDDVTLAFVQDSRRRAVSAFRTLYGEQPQYVLFEQVAVTDSEPAGSRDEADDSVGEDSVHKADRFLEGGYRK